MKKSNARLSLVVLLGTLFLGLSSVAKAELYIKWMRAGKVDCPTTCEKTGLKYPISTGLDNKRKLSFYICLAFGKDKLGHGARVGFNLNGESSCTTVVDDKIYKSKRYYCQCTNNPRPNIPR